MISVCRLFEISKGGAAALGVAGGTAAGVAGVAAKKMYDEEMANRVREANPIRKGAKFVAKMFDDGGQWIGRKIWDAHNG